MSEQQRLYIGGDNEIMRLSLIASLIVVLMAIPASHSQSEYPRCSAEHLQTVLSAVPAYDALRMTASQISSLDDVTVYAEEQLRFRDTVWDSAPRCTESIDFFWQTTRESAYIAASLGHALRYSRVFPWQPRFQGRPESLYRVACRRILSRELQSDGHQIARPCK